MLQQTQVSTVLAYYERFLLRFGDVQALASASVDDVLALWSGLGYYSRARLLHRCAQQVVADWNGCFPERAEILATLPGIGRSTAAAIAAFCFGERSAILDGNVKRVLARVFAIEDDLAQAGPVRALWARAEALLPTTQLQIRMSAYTQGLMDLGATICTPRQPRPRPCHERFTPRLRADHRRHRLRRRALGLYRRGWFRDSAAAMCRGTGPGRAARPGRSRSR